MNSRKRNSVLVTSCTSITTFIDKTTKQKRVIRISDNSCFEDIVDQIKREFDLFDKLVSLFQPSGTAITNYDEWKDDMMKWEANIHPRKIKIVSNEVEKIKNGLWNRDINSVITAAMSLWEIACEKENVDHLPTALIAKTCSLLHFTESGENSRLFIAVNAAALWMISSKCKGNISFYRNIIVRLYRLCFGATFFLSVRSRKIEQSDAISKLLLILSRYKNAAFQDAEKSKFSKKLYEAFPGDKFLLYVVGALAFLCQETAGR
jgi:hypothetical protein